MRLSKPVLESQLSDLISRWHGSVATRLSKAVLESQLWHVHFSQRLRASACVLSSCGPYTHCSFPNCHHFSEQRKCFALNRKSRSGTGTHLSEQRRCSSAHGRLAAHVPKLWYRHFVSSHMPLLVSKLRSVTVGEDHVITSTASNFCRAFVVARKVVPYAN